MKRMFLLLTGLGLLTLISQAQAQDRTTDSRRFRNDPTYSTGNYKHANKAAAARQWEAKSGVPVQQPNPGDAILANYKQQIPVAQPVGGVTVDHTPSEELANRNYKMQVPAPATTPEDVASRKRQSRTDKNTSTGN